MKEIIISPIIMDSLNLSSNERKVFDVLLRKPMGRNVSAICRDACLPRTTGIYILGKLEKRKIVEKVPRGKRMHWKYRKGLEFMKRKYSRE